MRELLADFDDHNILKQTFVSEFNVISEQLVEGPEEYHDNLSRSPLPKPGIQSRTSRAGCGILIPDRDVRFPSSGEGETSTVLGPDLA
jgi:hypothetical protein